MTNTSPLSANNILLERLEFYEKKASSEVATIYKHVDSDGSEMHTYPYYRSILACELIESAPRLIKALRVAVEGIEIFKDGGRHYNETQNGQEECARCGRNFRDIIHWRSREHTTDEKEQAAQILSTISSLLS